MDEQEQQNIANEEQNVQMEPTPLSPPPSHNKLIIGIVAGFVLIVAGVAGAYFLFQPKAPLPQKQQKTAVSTTKSIFEKPVINVNLTTTKLMTIPEGVKFRSQRVLFSPNGYQVAYINDDLNNDISSVILNGNKQTDYKFISFSGFSPDGEQLAYEVGVNGKQVIVFDNQEGKQYGSVGSSRFSDDGKHFIYTARNLGKHFVVVDDKEGNLYEDIYSKLFISQNGNTIAFVATDGRKNKEVKTEYFFVINNKESKRYDLVTNPALSLDGQQFAYTAYERGNPMVVLNDVEGKKYKVTGSLTFSPDGRQFAYVASDEKSRVVLNGEEGKIYDGFIKFLTFSPDSKKLAYRVVPNYGKAFVVSDFEEGKVYFDIKPDSITFSPDGKQLAYTAESEGKHLVVLNNKEGKQYEEILSGPTFPPVFSPDGTHLLYIAQENGEYFVVLDGNENKKYDFVFFPQFSPDSGHFAFIAKDGEKYMAVIDGVESESYDYITSPLFTPDSKHFAFGARIGSELWWVVESIQ